MKLASLRDGTAQGRLVIVSNDQSTAVRGTAARTLLAALQNCIIGSGTVSDPDRQAGSATLVELRAVEKMEHGEPRTPFLRFGDRIEIDVLDQHGHSMFGKIDHQVLRCA
jgi:hypothetical protein